MQKKSLLIIFLVVFIDLLGFGIIVPILPYYANSFNASATTLALLLVSYSGAQFLFASFWGSISDRVGRRPIILITILGVGGSMIILGQAHSLVLLFVARILAGFFGGNISTAAAYIADITPPENRTRGMGVIGAAIGLGFMFGPALGGILSKFGFDVVAYTVSGLAFLNFIFAFFQLKEPKLPEGERKEHRNPINYNFWKTVLAQKQTGAAIIIFFIISFGISQLETSVIYFLDDRFHLTPFHAGLLLALAALPMVGIQGGAIGRLNHLFGETKLILWGSVLMVVGLVVVAFSFNLALLIPFMIIFSLGRGLTHPTLSGLVSRFAENGKQGAALGVFQSSASLARVLSPLLAGAIYDHVGIYVPFLVGAGFCFLALLFTISKKKVWEPI